jgi:hypothetical protein
MSPTARKSRFFTPDPAAPESLCENPGCALPGEFRAPQSPQNLRAYRWFCLDHVRAYNASWDFYKGMSAHEIESERREDSGWQRPTWPLGRLGARAPFAEAMEAELNNFAFGQRAKPSPRPDLPKDLREALQELDLTWPLTMAVLKARYKQLAKRHHPDMNQGNEQGSEKLKRINLAYATLRGKLAAEAQPG